MVRQLPAPSRPAGLRRFARAVHLPWSAYGVMGLVLLAYLVSLVLRSEGQSSTLIDGWLVATFEATAAVLCLSYGLSRQRDRAAATALGLALLAWAIGDFVLTAQTAGGADAPSPSAADLFYLCFYPLAYTALVLLLRKEVRRFYPGLWMDGAIAGLGAAALCATFAFKALLHTTGDDPLGVAANLAYPVGDVLLLGLVVCASAVLPGRFRAPWILFASACALNAVGDTFNLFHSSAGSLHIGTVFDGIAWPAAILMMSLSVWLHPGRGDSRLLDSTPGFLLPGLGALAGLAVLFAGTIRHIDQAALALATATLAVVGLRLGVSLKRLRNLTEERHRQALTDELTGLGNRRLLQRMLDGFFAPAADDEPPPRLAFLFIDLDRFKEINDSFGHSAGDELLRQIGPRLKGLLRTSDLLVRVGGDELGVVLQDTDTNHAATVAERLIARLREPFLVGAVRVRISASVGIAIAPTDAIDCAGLMRCADLAMYRAKASGTAVRFYQKEIDDEGNRLRLVQEMRTGLEQQQFILHYQPQIDLQSGEVCAVEALLRWSHPRLGMVPPLEFLPLAEDSGLMPALTAVVLDQALAQCARWRAAGRQLSVSVNVSASNLIDPGFIELVRNTLTRHVLPPSALILEITETTVLSDFESCRDVIAQLRELGLDVSIDDFGAGFTSLAYLGSLAVRELKLDRTFITHLTDDGEKDLALVRATIELGHALGLRVVAEGIEDAATLDVLTRAGCDLAQGFYISKPVPATALLLRAHSDVPRLAAG